MVHRPIDYELEYCDQFQITSDSDWNPCDLQLNIGKMQTSTSSQYPSHDLTIIDSLTSHEIHNTLTSSFIIQMTTDDTFSTAGAVFTKK